MCACDKAFVVYSLNNTSVHISNEHWCCYLDKLYALVSHRIVALLLGTNENEEKMYVVNR